ncbi:MULTISPECIES: hypothetical protein [Arthrobacter]|uniref:AbiEi antitoxin C-terminal domain-containing protein n=2 Tax=Arthrobacter TaxID=1663 RepID=A0ABU9KGQ5_9MICC|nr:hypothetical protein [Arthrobacter sp. YJM1]MDP5226070.1 hypothetical protein [Arthrobacter sp. YJM1]
MDNSVSRLTGRQSLLRPGHPFSPAELGAMALDGLTRPVAHDLFMPASAVIDARTRARAMALRIPTEFRQRVVVGRLSAAWVHGHGPEPLRTVLLVDRGHRAAGLRRRLRADFHEVGLGSYDLLSLGGLLVTTPLRTAVDIAGTLRADLAVPVLRSMLEDPGPGFSWRLLRLAVEHTVPPGRIGAALEKVDACLG